MQYGPIKNGSVRARGDATVHYRTILRVAHADMESLSESRNQHEINAY